MSGEFFGIEQVDGVGMGCGGLDWLRGGMSREIVFFFLIGGYIVRIQFVG